MVQIGFEWVNPWCLPTSDQPHRWNSKYIFVVIWNCMCFIEFQILWLIISTTLKTFYLKSCLVLLKAAFREIQFPDNIWVLKLCFPIDFVIKMLLDKPFGLSHLNVMWSIWWNQTELKIQMLAEIIFNFFFVLYVHFQEMLHLPSKF